MRMSTGLVNALASITSLREALAGFVIDVYSGAQPTLPDSAASGTLLYTLTNGSGAYTTEVSATGTVTISGTIGGSISAVTVNGLNILDSAVTPVTDAATTAAALALAINRSLRNQLFVATNTAGSAVVTLTAINGLGTQPNGWTLATTATTVTATAGGALSGGVAAVNGLHFDVPTTGTISKLASETWSGNAVASGTAGWFRIRGNNDAGTASSTTAVRLDGSIGTSGADINLGSLTITSGAPQLLSSFAATIPQQ